MEHQVIDIELLDIPKYIECCISSNNDNDFHLSTPLLKEQINYMKVMKINLELENKYLQLKNEFLLLEMEKMVLKFENMQLKRENK